MNRARGALLPDTRSAGPSCRRPTTWRPRATRSVYRTNATTRDGEHGNALLSRWPIGDIGHHDVSDHRFEQRGLLHVPVHVERRPGARDRRPLRPDPLQPGAPGRSGSARFIEREVPRRRAADRRRRLQRLGRQARRADDGLRPDPRLRAGRSVVARQHLSLAHAAVLDGPHLRRAASAASRPRCRAARPGRACRTTCRWSRSSRSPRAVTRMASAVAATSEPSASPALRPGHAIDLLKGGEALFPALVQAIDARPRRGPARDLHLRVRRRAARGRRGAGARRARAACAVRVVVDGFGTGDVAGRVAGALEAGRRAVARLQRRRAAGAC